MSDRDQSGGSWTLLTGHGRVLVEIGRDPGARIRDISAAAGLTERTVQAIVADLEAAGYITRTRTGRRVRYTVNHDSMFRHPAQEGQRVGPFLSLLAAAEEDAPTTPKPDDSEMGRRQTLCGRKCGRPPPEPCSDRIFGCRLDLGLWRRHDRHACLSPWLTGCW
jgi:MarR family protein